MEIRLLNKIKISINRIQPSNKDENPEKRIKSFIPTESMPVSRANDTNNFFVHIHIPKTGGTTFNTILEKNFKQSYEPFTGRFIHEYPFLNNRQIENYIAKHSGIKCVTSHMFRAILPYQTAKRNIVAIAFIREPVDKFFSFYFHMRHRYGVECIEKKYKLDEYIDKRIEAVNEEKFQGYLNQFTGIDNQESFEYVQKLVESQNLHLFSTYKMSEALKFLQKKYPDDFKDIFYEKENISVKDQDVTQQMKEKVKNHISDFDWKLLELAENFKY